MYESIEKALEPWSLSALIADPERIEELPDPKDMLPVLQDIWFHGYGAISVEENLVRISTGGWSENEFIMEQVTDSIFHAYFFHIKKAGGHYYYKMPGPLTWEVGTRLADTPKYRKLDTYNYTMSETALHAFAAKYNRSQSQVLWLYQLCNGSDLELEALEEAMRSDNIFSCPDNRWEVIKILKQYQRV